MNNYLLSIDIPQYGRTHRLMVFEDECIQSIQNELSMRGIKGKYKFVDSNNKLIANDLLFSNFNSVEASGNLSIIKVKIKFDEPEYEKLTHENFDIIESSTQEFSFHNDFNKSNKKKIINNEQQQQNPKESEHESHSDNDLYIPLTASQDSQSDDNNPNEDPQSSILQHTNISKENEENQNKPKENESNETKPEEAQKDPSSKESASYLSDLSIGNIPDQPDDFIRDSLNSQELNQQKQSNNDIQLLKSENIEITNQKQENTKNETSPTQSSIQSNVLSEVTSSYNFINANKLSENKNISEEKIIKQDLSNPNQEDISNQKSVNIMPSEIPNKINFDKKLNTTEKNSPVRKVKQETHINNNKTVDEKSEIKMPTVEFPKSETKPSLSTESKTEKRHKSKVKNSDAKEKIIKTPKPPMPPPESPKPSRFTPSQSSSNLYNDPPSFSELISNLTEIGFERKYAENALRRSNYDLQKAANLLFSNNGIVEEQQQVNTPDFSQADFSKVANDVYNNLTPSQKSFVDKMVDYGFTLQRVIEFYNACDFDDSTTEALLKSS